jgi:hypothetical protein
MSLLGNIAAGRKAPLGSVNSDYDSYQEEGKVGEGE